MPMNFERIFPHAVAKGIVKKLYESIDYNAAIGKRTNWGSRGVDVLYHMMADEISANTVVGNSSIWRRDIPANDGTLKQMAIPYYKVQTSYTVDADSEAHFEKLDLGISEQEFKRAISIQSMGMRRAHIVFFGADATEKQGLFNASSETTALPADSASNTKLTTYIPGELLDFLVAQIRKISDLSYNMLKPITIVAPIDAINYLRSKIVPLTNYQEKGAGTSSIAKVFENIVYDMNGINVKLVPCSYMKGKGSGSKDVMLIIAPGIEVKEEEMGSTAYFNNVGQDDYVNTFMDDALEFQEYPNPEIDEVRKTVFTSIYTPAYSVRADAIRSIEYTY